MKAWYQGQFDLVLCAWLFAEIERILGKPFFRSTNDEKSIQLVLRAFRHSAEWVDVVDPGEHVGAASHSGDDYVLATAALGECQYIVTGDKQLLERDPYQGIRIITAAEFADVLDRAP